MIWNLTKSNLDLINNSMLSREIVEKEMENNPFAKYLILEENNQIIGYLYYSDIYDRAEINQIEINSIHRNCGKASELLKKMIETVEKDITLEVRTDNIPALKLYRKFGFHQTAIRKGYYQGIDGILMERKN